MWGSAALQAGKALPWGKIGSGILGAAGLAGTAYGTAQGVDALGFDPFGSNKRRADQFSFEAGFEAEGAMGTTQQLLEQEDLNKVLRQMGGGTEIRNPAAQAANMAQLENAIEMQRNQLGRLAATSGTSGFLAALEQIGL